jgi:membrane fusion protein, multidrug efflux system
MTTVSYVSDLASKISLRPSRQAIKRAALALALTLGVAGAADFGYGYLTTGRYLESTDDAYVKADSTIVAPKVSGYIAEVLVSDNQPVKTGQLLARIDDRDFEAALAQARADVDASEAAVRNLDAQIALQQPIIEQESADVAAAEANLKFAREEQARYDGLMKTGSGTIQRAQQTDAVLRAKDRAVTARQIRSARSAEESRRSHHRTSEGGSAGRSRAGRRAADGAQFVLYEDHRPGRRYRRRPFAPGRSIRAGTQLMAVVPLDAVYVVANFKETQLTHVRNGQPVEIRIDSFHSTKLKGHVDSLSPASGLEFALLPPDNATGNFTKIVQRVPVKIVLDDRNLTGLLRPGMSAEPTVNTKATVLAEHDQQTSTTRIASSGVKQPGS